MNEPLFKKVTKHRRSKDGYSIDCVKGLWGVYAPTKEIAMREAVHYFVQYESDDEYKEF